MDKPQSVVKGLCWGVFTYIGREGAVIIRTMGKGARGVGFMRKLYNLYEIDSLCFLMT